MHVYIYTHIQNIYIVYIFIYLFIYKFILVFILETYIAPLQTLLLRGAPSPVTAKGEGLEGDVKFGRGGHQQGTQLNREIIPGRWAHH